MYPRSGPSTASRSDRQGSLWGKLLLRVAVLSLATGTVIGEDSTRSLPSGVAFVLPDGWSLKPHDEGATVTGPEGVLIYELVDVDAPESLPLAIELAWRSRRPDMSRKISAGGDAPPREGWDQRHWAVYETSPSEGRYISALAERKGSLVLVTLVDVPRADRQRRQSEINLFRDSLRPPGYVSSSYADRTPRELSEQDVAALDTFIERIRVAADVPGLAVSIVDRSRIILQKGYGVRRRGESGAVTPETLFLVASNNKPLVTLAYARLVDANRLEWDTPVQAIYPEFQLGDSDTAVKMRIKHLICACTGLPRKDFEWMFTMERATGEDQMAFLAEMRPTTEFGELFQYSNALAAAAGFIVGQQVAPEGTLRDGYRQAMREEVFEPLGMQRTTFDFADLVEDQYASPHRRDLDLSNSPLETSPNSSAFPIRSGDGIWSNVEDFSKYVQMELRNGLLIDGKRYISEETVSDRREPQVSVGKDQWYGMGLYQRDIKGIRVFGHGGAMPGYQTDFFFIPKLGVGGAVFTNADSGQGIPDTVVQRILEFLYDAPPTTEAQFYARLERGTEFLERSRASWVVPPNPEISAKLAFAYGNDVLGKIDVEVAAESVKLHFGGWRTRVAAKPNPDGSISFVPIDVAPFLTFTAIAGDGRIEELELRAPQSRFRFQAID